MRQDTVTTTVYEFKELADDVQEKVIEDLWDINVDHEWWSFGCLMELTIDETKKLIKQELTESELTFLNTDSLFGHTIRAFDIDRGNFIQMDIVIKDDELFRKFLGISEELWDNCYFEFISSSGYGDTRMEITENDHNEEFTTDEIVIIERAEDIMNEKILDALQGLRETYEYLTSLEIIVETITLNGYEFTVEGNIY